MSNKGETDFRKTNFMKNYQMTDQDKIFDEQAAFLIKKQKLERIDNFNGQYYGFLNNDYPSFVHYEGYLFPSINAAFQAARTTKDHIRHKISLIDNPDELWDIAVNIEDPPNWQKDRLKVMELILRDKFRRNKEIRERLKLTGKKSLINTYPESSKSNLFWGIVDGKGQNQLGRLLEEIRNDIHENIDLDKWIILCFNPEDDANMLPEININVVKDEQIIEKITLKGKSYYIFGNLKQNDVFCAHQSVSRQHTCIFIDREQNVKSIDLGSKSGTFINEQPVEQMVGVKLNTGDTLNFAISTRKYVLDFNYKNVYDFLNKKQKEIQIELSLLEKINNPNLNKEDLRNLLGFSIDDTLFVSNLPQNTNHRELKDIFSKFGKVKEVRIPIDRQTGQQKLYALVTYENENDTKKAILKADRFELNDRKLRVQMADKFKTAKMIEESKTIEKLGFSKQKEEELHKLVHKKKFKSQSKEKTQKTSDNKDKEKEGQQQSKNNNKLKRKSRSRSRSNHQKNRHKSKSVQKKSKSRSRSSSKNQKKSKKQQRSKDQKHSKRHRSRSSDSESEKKHHHKSNKIKSKVKDASSEKKKKKEKEQKKDKENEKKQDQPDLESLKEKKNTDIIEAEDTNQTELEKEMNKIKSQQQKNQEAESSSSNDSDSVDYHSQEKE